MQFLKKETKYSRWYIDLIQARLKRKKVLGYCEKHHVHPKSLGGSDDLTNIIKLTAREHYIAHFLLFKHFKSIKSKNELIKMGMAFWGMCAPKNKANRINSNIYSELKEIWYGRMSNLDRSCPEYRQKISKSLTGIKRSKETKDRMSIAQKNNNGFRNKKWKEKLSISSSGVRGNKFKGLFVTPYGYYFSSRDAEKALNINRYTIYARCKNNSTIQRRTIRDSKYLSKDDEWMIGLTWSDIGWCFIECDVQIINKSVKQDYIVFTGDKRQAFVGSLLDDLPKGDYILKC